MGYHNEPCLEHVTVDWFKGLQRAAKIYIPVHVIPLLLFRYHKLARDPVGQIVRTCRATLSSCMFLSTYVFCVKGSQCFLRNWRQCDASWHALVAGMLTSFACVFEQPSRVSELMLYCMPRSLEAAWNYLRKYGFVKSVPRADVMLFSLAMAILCSSQRTDFKLTFHRALCFALGSSPSATAASPSSARIGRGAGAGGGGGSDDNGDDDDSTSQSKKNK